MELLIAQAKDIKDTLALHYTYQVDSIADEDRADGFVTTPFTREQLELLVQKEQGLFIARQGRDVVGYVMAASWEFWSAWPMFAYMIKGLPELSYKGTALSVDNSFQYGPACIHKQMRGTGVFQDLFVFSCRAMAKRYPILVTFINKNNPRSYAAHTRKLGLDVIREFEYNNNTYYELACEVSTYNPSGRHPVG